VTFGGSQAVGSIILLVNLLNAHGAKHISQSLIPFVVRRRTGRWHIWTLARAVAVG